MGLAALDGGVVDVELPPGRGPAVGTQGATHGGRQGRAVGALREVLLAAPDHFHRTRREVHGDARDLLEIVGGDRHATPESAAHRQRHERDGGDAEPNPLGERGPAAEAVLLAGPDGEVAVLELGGGVDGLHRGVVEVGHAVGGLDDAAAGRTAQLGLGVADAVDRGAAAGGEGLVLLRKEAGRADGAMTAVGEQRRQGRQRAARLPVAPRHHGDGPLQGNDALHAGHAERRGGIDGDEAAAVNGCRLHRGVEHAGELNVDAVAGRALDLGGDVEARRRGADDLEVLAGLEGRAGGHAEAGSLGGQLAVAGAPPAAPVGDDAVGDDEVVRRDVQRRAAPRSA